MARRRTVLGIPIGKRKPSIAPKLIAAGAGVAAVPAIAVARKAAGAVSRGREKVAVLSDAAGKVGAVTKAVESKDSTIGKIGAVIGEVRKMGGGNGPRAPKLSHLIEEHIEVAVARSVAYNQWTQFETFPSIVKGAERVEQKDRDNVEWTAKIGPSRRTWQGEITEQVPDERISWESKGGLKLKGVVTFHSLDDELTRVLVEMEYDPHGTVEHVGNLLRVQRRRVRRDLRLFKHFVELRGEETGAWRSRIAKKDGSGGAGSNGDSASSSPRRRPAAGAGTKARQGAARARPRPVSSAGPQSVTSARPRSAPSGRTRSAASSSSYGRSAARSGTTATARNRSSSGGKSGGVSTATAKKSAAGSSTSSGGGKAASKASGPPRKRQPRSAGGTRS